MTKDEWCDIWRIPEGERDEMWARKLAMDEKTTPVGVFRFVPDIDSFVSPIDGTVINGRAGLREHCKRHDVVPTQELAGLPTRMPEHKPSAKEVRERREMIYAQVDKARQRGEL